MTRMLVPVPNSIRVTIPVSDTGKVTSPVPIHGLVHRIRKVSYCQCSSSPVSQADCSYQSFPSFSAIRAVPWSESAYTPV